MSSPASATLTLVKPDAQGVQRRLFDAFSDGYEMSPDSLRRLLVDCGVADGAVTSVLESSVLQVSSLLEQCFDSTMQTVLPESTCVGRPSEPTPPPRWMSRRD